MPCRAPCPVLGQRPGARVWTKLSIRTARPPPAAAAVPARPPPPAARARSARTTAAARRWWPRRCPPPGQSPGCAGCPACGSAPAALTSSDRRACRSRLRVEATAHQVAPADSTASPAAPMASCLRHPNVSGLPGGAGLPPSARSAGADSASAWNCSTTQSSKGIEKIRRRRDGRRRACAAGPRGRPARHPQSPAPGGISYSRPVSTWRRNSRLRRAAQQAQRAAEPPWNSTRRLPADPTGSGRARCPRRPAPARPGRPADRAGGCARGAGARTPRGGTARWGWRRWRVDERGDLAVADLPSPSASAAPYSPERTSWLNTPAWKACPLVALARRRGGQQQAHVRPLADRPPRSENPRSARAAVRPGPRPSTRDRSSRRRR